MRKLTFVAVAACFALLPDYGRADETVRSAGPSEDTEILESSENGTICPGSELRMNDDGNFENAYAWSGNGVAEPDYGAWAECYDSDFVCGIQFFFTQTGEYAGHRMDVYVWDSVADGNPPPGPDPGNVLCLLPGIQPGGIAFWPAFSVHEVQVCCPAGGPHFVGFWGDWPGTQFAWYVAGDEDGPGLGCPRTKITPGQVYPSGWQHPDILSTFDDCKDLGIREHAGPGDCPPTARTETTWGRIKSLF